MQWINKLSAGETYHGHNVMRGSIMLREEVPALVMKNTMLRLWGARVYQVIKELNPQLRVARLILIHDCH